METKQFENEDRLITYYVGGNKYSEEVLLFLNGLYVGNKSWIKQQRYSYFNKNYKMIFFDYPGVGESIEKSNNGFSFDDVVNIMKGILDLEQCNKCNLIGYSVGGIIGLWFIHKFPSYVEKLLLLNTGVDIDKFIENRIIEVVSELLNNVSLGEIFKSIYPLNHSDAYLEKITDMEESTINSYIQYNKNQGTLIMLLKAIRDRPNIKSTLKKINVPTLIVNSEEDKIFPYKYQKELIENIKNNDYYSVKKCGHASFIEKYKEVNELIENFLKK